MELSDTTIKDATRTEATKSITTSIRTNEIVPNARPPTTSHGKKPLPTVVIKPRKVRLNIGANRNHQVLVSGVSRRQYRSIPTVGSQQPQPRRPPTTHTSSIPNTNFDIDDDDHLISKNNNDSEFDDDDIDHYIANTVESLETYVAIQSLQQSIETCIIIPMVAQSNFAGGTGSLSTMTSTSTMDHIRGVLECQIFEYFSSSSSLQTSHDTVTTNAATSNIKKCSISKQKIQKQLQHLQHQNVITCIPILQQETSHMLYVFTKDYTTYILEQHEHCIRNDATTTTVTTTTSIDRPNSILLLQWWIRQLLSKASTIIGSNGTPYITVFNIEQAWYNDPPSHHSSFLQQHHIASAATQVPLLNVPTILQYLQDAQLILSASYDHSTYQLWLPNVWGTMVLPKLLQLCKDVVLYIKRSSYHERSVTSIRERFPIYHAPPMQRPQGTSTKLSDANIYISIENIIVPYLVAQRRVQRLERPSGMCLKLLE